MIKKLTYLSDPLFVATLLLLLINDLCLKQIFPGFITGKLSDFSGLTAFVLFCSALSPKHKTIWYLLSAFLFVFWKSPNANSLIEAWNYLGWFNVGRVADPGDLLSLTVLPAVFFYKLRPAPIKIARFARFPIAALAIFAFCSTSYIKSHTYDRKYSFPISLEQLIYRLNQLENGCNNIPFSIDLNVADTMLICGTDTNFVSYSDSVHIYIDTVYIYDKILKRTTNNIDTIYTYKYRSTDTIVVHGNNPVCLWVNVSDILKNQADTICDCLEAKVRMYRNDKSSGILLETISMNHCVGKYIETGEKEEKELLLKTFEKNIIQVISSQ